MKRILTFTLLMTIGLSTTSFAQENTKPSSPEKLGAKVFQSFQEESFDLFLSLIFTEADCEIMVKNADASDSLKTAVVKQMKGLAHMIRSGAKENFNFILKQGHEKGVQWSKVKLEDIKYAIKDRQNIKSSDIFLLCKYKAVDFAIKLDNCHKSDAWLMMDTVEIKFKE